MPLVSVIMPVCNAGPSLGAAGESVLAQTWRDFELIVVDDGSTDGGDASLHRLRDRRVRRFRTEWPGSGAAVARNLGVTQATGRYLAFLDADDLCEPDRLAVQVDLLRRHPEVGVLASRAWVLRGNDRVLSRFGALTPEAIEPRLLFDNPIAHSSVCLRREVWQPYEAGRRFVEDYELWSRLARRHLFWLHPRPLVTYREHAPGAGGRDPRGMAAAVAEVHRRQFAYHGLTVPTDLHALLSRWPADADLNSLEAAQDWLVTVGRLSPRFAPGALRRRLEAVWFTLCLNSWALGSDAFRAYCRSPLARLTPTRVARFLRRHGRRALPPSLTP